MIGQKFIKNLEITSEGDINYDEIIIEFTSKLKDFEGALIDLNFEDKYITSEEFKVKSNRKDSLELYSDEYLVLKDAITDLIYDDDTTEIKFVRIGEFWRD